MPPGSASASSRAAMLTPSPKMSSSSTMMSPTLMPMRNSMRRPPARRRCARPCRAASRWRTAPHRRRCELDQHPVAGGLDDAAVVLRDRRIEEFTSVGVQPRQRAFLVDAHQPAVADDVGREDGGKPSHVRSSAIAKCLDNVAQISPWSGRAKRSESPTIPACSIHALARGSKAVLF